jgi:hypothetical protein
MHCKTFQIKFYEILMSCYVKYQLQFNKASFLKSHKNAILLNSVSYEEGVILDD